MIQSPSLKWCSWVPRTLFQFQRHKKASRSENSEINAGCWVRVRVRVPFFCFFFFSFSFSLLSSDSDSDSRFYGPILGPAAARTTRTRQQRGAILYLCGEQELDLTKKTIRKPKKTARKENRRPSFLSRRALSLSRLPENRMKNKRKYFTEWSRN